MATTYVNLQDIVLDMIDRSESEDRTRVKQFINMAGRDVWTSRPWRERRATAQIETQAPYDTGTIAIAEDATTVTGTGTTFPAYTASTTKVAKSYTDPWYTIATRDSGTQLTLANAYAESTETASAFVCFRDVYPLASDVDTILSLRVVYSGNLGTMPWVAEKRMDDLVTLPALEGVPRYFCLQDNTSAGLRQVKLWPVPDDTYRIQYRYLKGYTDMTADADECVVPENRRDLVLQRSLVWAYQYVQEFDRAAAQLAFYERELARHWRAETDMMPKVGRVRKFDDFGRSGGNPLTLPLADV